MSPSSVFQSQSMSSQFTTTTKEETARFAATGGGASRAGLCVRLIVLAGCQQQMADQPSYKPLDASSFFTNGQSSRQLVAGTVARGHLEIDTHFYTAASRGPTARRKQLEPPRRFLWARTWEGPRRRLMKASLSTRFRFPITLEVLKHGRDRFLIYCAVCHDPRGTGRGKIVERGYTAPPLVPYSAAARRPRGTSLRGRQRGLWFHALLRGPDFAARPLGDRGLREGTSAQPAFPGGQAQRPR